MSACPICKTNEHVRPSFTTGYQRRCGECGVLFNEQGVGATL